MSSEKQSVIPNRANIKGETNNNPNNKTNDALNSPVNNNSTIVENGQNTVVVNKNSVNTNIQNSKIGEKNVDEHSIPQKRRPSERERRSQKVERTQTEKVDAGRRRGEIDKIEKSKTENVDVYRKGEEIDKIEKSKTENVDVYRKGEEIDKIEKSKTENVDVYRKGEEIDKIEKSKTENVDVYRKGEEIDKIEKSKTENVDVYRKGEEIDKIEKSKTENVDVYRKGEEIDKIEKSKTENVDVYRKGEEIDKIEKSKTENVDVYRKGEEIDKIEKSKTENVGDEKKIETIVNKKKDGEETDNKGMLTKVKLEEENQLIESDVEKEKGEGYRNHYASESIEKLCKEFDLADINIGLSFEQVKINRERYGENHIEKDSITPIWLIFLSQYYSPVVMLLLIAAMASLALNEVVEGISIITIVTLNACLATYMEKSSGDAIAKLAEMASPQCTVLRNGQKIIIPSRDVVVGDVVIITAGDSISADLRLIEVIELKTNESLLTGESEDIKKSLVPTDYTTPFCTNLCFATTSVTNGCGKGIVISTGLNTQVGKIASQLKKSSEGSKLTPLQVSLNRLGGLIGLIAIIVLMLIITLAILINYKDPAHADKDPLLVIIIIGVGFAVSSVPEGLPMVVTITLSAGAKDMVRKNANVRKLPAVETLGCCSVICSDKTGTLTEGKMTAINIVTFCKNSKLHDKNELTKTYDFYPTKGFEPSGGIFDSLELTSEIKKKIVLAKNKNISYDSILQNYGNPESKNLNVYKTRSLMLAAYLNSYDTTLSKNLKTGKWEIQGNMSEGPIIVAAAKAGYNIFNNSENNEENYLKKFKRLEDLEITFNSSRKMKVIFYKLIENNKFENINLKNNKTNVAYTHIAFIKGAPDKLIDISTNLLKETQGEIQVSWDKQISDNEKLILTNKNIELSQKALRVLAVCIKPLTDTQIEHLRTYEDADERLEFIKTDEQCGFIPLGYIASFDPPRSGVKEAIQTCRNAQVKVIMITGDQKTTAIAIGKLIGLINNKKSEEDEIKDNEQYDLDNNSNIIRAIECSELHINKNPNEPILSDDELDKFVDNVLIYSRAQPEDKITIVQSLKRKGYLVAMTGDGVNDAPALKAADIGVAMGINGTEVAKGASEMILIDDNFCTVVSAIDVGRTIYSNIQKFVCFLLGTNIGEILYLSVSIITQMPFPLEALQILFLNLMTDGCPAVALSREPPNADNMKTPPRPKKQPIMTKRWWLYGIIPHTIFEAICVLLSLAFSLYICTGSYTLNDIHNSCKTVNIPNSSDPSKFFEYKYFCSTYEYRISPDYIGWITNLNFWDPRENKPVTFWGAAKGKIKNITPTHESIHQDIRIIMQDQCLGNLEEDEYGWCKPSSNVTAQSNNENINGTFNKHFEDISSKGSKRGRTIAFISAVWCEMLRAYTVRSWEPFYKVFNRNMWMHFACSISATMTFLATCIPGITTILNTTCLLWWQYLFGIFWAMINLILDEIIPKVIYRRKYMSIKN
ncbi:non-SERCA-type Ca2+ -transporting P-ATPase, putative [Plasmodium berghei ANKA]|uniref:P-type sodium-transporting ATPase4 n=1 Tax=Plasmodium berghei (strain Anka) TaxID=5823 RepID=A0A509AJJ3_PLABA|nr:non-SERCA-type Ca2+ -transporting P-ATPase, putative [Plasmodium berghei ANKA]VUC54779.1 non-SERCA-type Ca2+ -transporting P-ATPase, putative [Plasmodium berghei ANKA]|eukprot:XP_034420604.1 non-SERCA-type Ca2+ -transporting P-ATPase, putative [Plasmodium berghei ANKA]